MSDIEFPTRENELILQLHVAEYAALANRSTQLIYIASTIWPILILFFALILPLSIWKTSAAPYLLWFTSVAVEFTLLMWIENTFLQFQNIAYFEKKLRPLVAELVGSTDFWLYEQFMNKSRKSKSQWWEYFPAVAASLILGGVAWYRGHIILQDGLGWAYLPELIGFCANLLVVISVFMKMRALIQTRRGIFPHKS